MSRARRAVFNLFVTLSLILLAILPLGYAGSSVVELSHRSAPAVVRRISLDLDRGRVALWWQRETTAPPPPPAAVTPPRSSVRADAKFRWPPAWRRAIWDFDAHVLRAPGIPPGQWTFLLACPIWCVAVPCLILPTIAWRRWRRRKRDGQPQGFEVTRSPAMTAPPA